MATPLSVVLIPGLNCSARLYAEQIPALWRFGPVQVADHTRDDSMDAIASRILAAAPPRFALAGLVGDGDELTPPALSQEIAAGVTGSRLVVIADCGHLSTMERPDAVNRALIEWMTG